MTQVARTAGPIRIAYDDVGTSEPALVLLPGWCSSRERWRATATLCAEQRRVISLEWRGHGDSDPAPGDFGVDELVEDAMAVIDACGLERFVPCSASHAGWVAIELRRRYGARVAAIVHADWMVTRPPDAFADLISELVSGDWEEARRALFRIWAAGDESVETERTLSVMAAHGEEMWRRAGRAILAAYTRGGSPLEALAELDPAAAVLHVYGQPQQPTYLEEQERFADVYPWFAVHKLATRTHFSMVEAPTQIASSIERFLESA